MKKIKVAVAILLIFLLSGCSVFSFNEYNIMCPPKATGNKAHIQKLIDKQSKGSYTLKYPKNGNNRSSIIMHDIDFDEEEEAIAFYSDKEGEHIHALFVEYENDEYVIVDDILLEVSALDRVDFADLNADKKSEILIGCASTTSSQNALSVYSYNSDDSQKVKAFTTSYTYSSLVTGDFNSDKKDDVLLISLYSGDIASKATLLTHNNSSLSEIGSTELDSNITALANVQYGQISYGTYGAFIDGISSAGDYTTQVVLFDKSAPALLNPLFSYSGYNLTRRSTQVCSTDFNKDELIDIPVCSLMEHSEKENADSVSRRIDWSNFNAETFALASAQSAIICPKDGYVLTIPQKWSENVTARYDESLRETTIYQYAYVSNEFKLQDKIVTIKAYSDDNFNKDNSGFTEFMRAGSTVYAYSIGNADKYLTVSGDEITSLFTLVNQ